MPDFTRLKTVLLSSNVQQQNPALYQVLDSLLTFLGNTDGKNLAAAISGSGSSGPAGPMGPSGPIGIFGLDGIDGNDGLPGLTGATGPSGVAGVAGIGIPGIDGIDGDNGIDIIPFLPPTQLLDLLGIAQGSILYRDANRWKLLAPGTSGYFLQTLGAGANPAWVTAAIGGGSLYNGAGNPQGSVGAAIGSLYQDTATGYLYQKIGGGSTVYGWYLAQPNANIGQMGPQAFALTPSGLRLATSSPVFSAYGPMATAVADAVDLFTATGAGNTYANLFVSGKFFKSIIVPNTNNQSSYLAATTNTRQWLDDDLDFWYEIRTGTDITNLRIWAGISSTVISDSDSFATGSNGALLFRYSTSAPDGGWIGQSSINGALNHSETATVATIAANTTYKLRIRFVRQGTPTVYFSVNDSTEIALTTTIPATGNAYFLIFGLTNKTASTHTINIRGIGGWQGS